MHDGTTTGRARKAVKAKRSRNSTLDDRAAFLQAQANDLEERLLFEQAVMTVARDFGELPGDADPVALVQEEVDCLAVTLGYDRCVFWRIAADEAVALAWHERGNVGLAPLGNIVTRADAPWVFAAMEEHQYCARQPDGSVRTAVGIAPRSESDQGYAMQAECRREGAAGVLFMDSRRLYIVCELIVAALHRARTAQELHGLRTAVARADRAARLGQLSVTVAHEVNQPLAAALSNAQAAVRLLDGESPDVAEAREALKDVVLAVQRAGAVVGRVRSLFTSARPKRGRIRLETLVGQVAQLARIENEAQGAVLVTDVAHGLPAVAGDAVQLQQLLLNLVGNARDAVRTRGRGQQRIVLRAGLGEDLRVALTVEDNGIGLPEGDVENVFAPFFTTKEDGFGMGLPICRQVAEQHGGRLEAFRLPAGGSRFVLTLPALA